MLKAMDFHGKKVLVTGAARRIGRGIARAFAEAGADVTVHYNRSGDEAEELAAEIRSLGRQCYLTSHDLSDTLSTSAWFDALLRKTGCPDILVNSASEFPPGDYDSLTEADLNRSMAIHVLSPLVMMRTMYRTGGNRCVVNILDTRIADRDPSHAAYHMAKRGLFTLSRDLAVEMAPRMRINAVAPGVILAPDGKDEAWIEGLKSTNPLSDRGAVADVTDAVLYLAGARFVTGQVISVDGGRHLKGNIYGL